MNEHENDTRIESPVEALHVAGPEGSRARTQGKDLVVDLSGIRRLDIANLSLLLTAQQQAQEEDRAIWLAGVPFEVWQALHAMGLGDFFKPFPVSREMTV